MAEVVLTVNEGVATLTLDAPERRNALTPAMAQEIGAACDAIDADPAVGAVVIQGAGPTFCAGAHRATLGAIAADPAGDRSYKELRAIYGAFIRIGQLEAPTVAAVRGTSVGAGVNLVFATDLRIMAEDAKIAPGFGALGFHPGGGHFALVARTAGREVATALGVFDQSIDGRRAADLGLAWEAVPEARVDERAHEIARAAARDPELSRTVVRSMRTELGPPAVAWPVAVEAETAAQLWSFKRQHDRRSQG
jgi:enoyl-CoA hydratase